MPYIPNADDQTQPTEDKFVVSAAAEFRELKRKVASLSSGGGGGGGGSLPALGGTSLSPFSLTNATPNDRVEFTNTAPDGWNLVPSKMTVSFEMVSVDYFTKNPVGHLAVVLRADTDIIATAIRGQGVAIGDLSGLAQNPSDLVPTPLLETFFNGLATGDNLLWGDSDGARSLGGMVDGVRYRFQVDSIVDRKSVV